MEEVAKIWVIVVVLSECRKRRRGQDCVSDCECLMKGRNTHYVLLLFPGSHQLHFSSVPTRGDCSHPHLHRGRRLERGELLLFFKLYCTYLHNNNNNA